MADTDNTQVTGMKTSNCLAYLIVFFVFLLLIALGFAVISFARGGEKLETAKYVFASIVPLVGSWMGAIIAHYFQKDNLAAATQSITNLASKVPGGVPSKGSTPVSEVMIKRADIKSIPDGVSTATPPDPDNYATIPLKALADKLRALNQQRLPLFRPKPDDSIRQVIHVSVIDAYLQQHPAPPSATPPVPTPATLQTFLDDPEVKKQLAGSFDFVAVTGTLSDVQKAMTQQCEDVFVTQNGKPAEPVLGWITSDRLAEALKM